MLMSFFLGFYDLLKDDLMKIIQESHETGQIRGALNKTFLAIVLKSSEPISSVEFHHRSCCNLIYKLISKIIENMIKPILSDIISKEHFQFLFKRETHDDVSLA
jgi:hypothetical protein